VDRPDRLSDSLSGRRRVSRAPSASPPEQFQALFDSLFKVLFIFPSRYLFLSVSAVFSLGRISARWVHSQTTGFMKCACV
uniref:Uncharacterized protein n=1 Tax=Cannabis sativa TaxID=3483 RepID=A0A803QSW7_CANSA